MTQPLPFLLATILLISRVAAAPQQWSQGDPSPEEQNALEWLNRARADPVGTLNGLIATSGSDPVLAACFAAQAPQTAAQFSAQLAAALTVAQANGAAFPRSAAISQAPLAFYPLFQQRAAALNLAGAVPDPMFPPGRSPPADFPAVPTLGTLFSGPTQTFSGPNATGGTASFGSFGGNYSELTQANLYDPALSSREWMLAWLCSPGSGSPAPEFLVQGDSLPDLNLGHTRLAGISVITRGDGAGGRDLAYIRGSSEFLTSSDLPFGPANTVFITGVAYRDQNANGRYDPGEGLSGVAVTLDHGDWNAVTATAGGYAIPVPANSGTYIVTAAGGPFSGASATVTVGSDSVKLDWSLPALAATLPPQVAVPGPSGNAHLLNLSTRGRVEPGASALIGGFVVSGPASAREQLLIRGVGPSLQTVGIPASECVPVTSLQIYSGAVVVAANTGWTTSADAGAAVARAAAQTGAFALTNWAGGGGDSAVIVTLAPGAYSAVVTPAPGTPAIDAAGHVGLVEVYEVSAAGGAGLINLSSRGLMGSGDAQLYIGATVSGTGQQRLLVRAAGPALAQEFGLSPVVANPVLTLYNAGGQVIATNDDWSLSTQTEQLRAIAISTGAFPFPEGSADSALLTLQSAGQYSAQLAAQSGTAATGIALVEIYSAP